MNRMTITEKNVINYLLDNPDFFLRNPELLQQDTTSEATSKLNSLLSRQVALLQEQYKKLSTHVDILNATASHNITTTKKMHLLMMSLLKPETYRTIFDTLYEKLRENFSVEQVILRIFAPLGKEIEFCERDNNGLILFEPVLSNDHISISALNAEQKKYLFRKQNNLMQSAVIIPMQGQDWKGVLVLGSQHPDKFSPDMGVDLLNHLRYFLSYIIESKIP